MNAHEHQKNIEELQALIDDTQAMLTRFEETGMDGDMLTTSC